VDVAAHGPLTHVHMMLSLEPILGLLVSQSFTVYMLAVDMQCDGLELLSGGDHGEFWCLHFGSSSFFTMTTDNVAILGNAFSQLCDKLSCRFEVRCNDVVNLSPKSDVMDAHGTSLAHVQPNPSTDLTARRPIPFS
jgi:hypothetical protein